MIFDQIIWREPTNDQKIWHQIKYVNGGLIDQIFDSNVFVVVVVFFTSNHPTHDQIVHQIYESNNLTQIFI